MKANERRQEIEAILQQSNYPVTASQLAERFQVSRQVIVGDIALLRARNLEIIATNSGYILPQSLKEEAGRYTGKLVCCHGAEQTEEEIRIILARGGVLEDVEIDHPVYGIIKGCLHIRNHTDLDQFLLSMKENEGQMLSSLTNGVHIHTINTPNIAVFKDIEQDLNDAKILYQETD